MFLVCGLVVCLVVCCLGNLVSWWFRWFCWLLWYRLVCCGVDCRGFNLFTSLVLRRFCGVVIILCVLVVASDLGFWSVCCLWKCCNIVGLLKVGFWSGWLVWRFCGFGVGGGVAFLRFGVLVLLWNCGFPGGFMWFAYFMVFGVPGWWLVLGLLCTFGFWAVNGLAILWVCLAFVG